jgi:hypothetical protein
MLSENCLNDVSGGKSDALGGFMLIFSDVLASLYIHELISMMYRSVVRIALTSNVDGISK